MGIDIYARWNGQTDEEIDAQYMSCFSPHHGSMGYLRESYHGEPYATQYLVAEAFEHPESKAEIPAAILRERLAHTLALVAERERIVYHETNPEEIGAIQHSYTEFVELCERKEAETGEPVTIIASF